MQVNIQELCTIQPEVYHLACHLKHQKTVLLASFSVWDQLLYSWRFMPLFWSSRHLYKSNRLGRQTNEGVSHFYAIFTKTFLDLFCFVGQFYSQNMYLSMQDLPFLLIDMCSMDRLELERPNKEKLAFFLTQADFCYFCNMFPLPDTDYFICAH